MHEELDWKVNLRTLERQRLTLLVVKDGDSLFRSNKHGLLPLLELVEANMDQLVGTTVIDRTLGIAAAKLLLWQHVQRIDALTVSRRALELLRHSGIVVNYEQMVPGLFDLKTGALDHCEAMSIKYDHPETLYQALREELLIFEPQK